MSTSQSIRMHRYGLKFRRGLQKGIASFAITIIAVSCIEKGRADEVTALLQSTCASEENLFSAEGYSFWDFQYKELKQTSSSIISSVIMLKDLVNKQVSCQVMGKTISIVAINYHPRTLTGFCSSIERGGLKVKIGDLTYFEDDDIYGGCDHSSEVSIEFGGIYLKICKTLFDGQTPWDISISKPTELKTVCQRFKA